MAQQRGRRKPNKPGFSKKKRVEVRGRTMVGGLGAEVLKTTDMFQESIAGKEFFGIGGEIVAAGVAGYVAMKNPGKVGDYAAGAVAPLAGNILAKLGS